MGHGTGVRTDGDDEEPLLYADTFPLAVESRRPLPNKRAFIQLAAWTPPLSLSNSR